MKWKFFFDNLYSSLNKACFQTKVTAWVLNMEIRKTVYYAFFVNFVHYNCSACYTMMAGAVQIVEENHKVNNRCQFYSFMQGYFWETETLKKIPSLDIYQLIFFLIYNYKLYHNSLLMHDYNNRSKVTFQNHIHRLMPFNKDLTTI